MIHLFYFLSLLASNADPITASLESFVQVSSYRVTVNSRGAGDPQSIRYFYKRPGFVRMEFITPHSGAVIVYSPVTKKARVRPLGFLKPLVLTLSPRNSLITSPSGHSVDASDIGSLLEEVGRLAKRGETRIEGKEKIGDRETLFVEVTGAGDETVGNGVHRYHLWLDGGTSLPVRTRSFNLKGDLLEDVLMDDLEINVEIPDSFFDI